MDKTPERFSKEYIENGELEFCLLKESHNVHLVLTLKVENYSKLKKRVFYYKSGIIDIYKWRFELVKAKGTLFVILSTNVQNKVVYFLLDNINSANRQLVQANEINNTIGKSVYVSEFCNRAILDPENKFLPGDALIVTCSYQIFGFESNNLLFPLDKMRVQHNGQEDNDYFKNIYLESFCADFTIVVRDSWFRVHKLVLVHRTKYMDKLQERDGIMFINRHVAVVDTFSHIMHRVLLYVYSGELEEMIPQFRAEIRRVAREMGIPRLVRATAKVFKSKYNS